METPAARRRGGDGSGGFQQGFAKHYERRGGREVGLRQEGDDLTCVATPNTSSIYRGRGGDAPPSRVPSLVVAAAPKPI